MLDLTAFTWMWWMGTRILSEIVRSLVEFNMGAFCPCRGKSAEI